MGKPARRSFISDLLPVSDIPILELIENESSGFEVNLEIGPNLDY
jgi:hypothetical protein